MLNVRGIDLFWPSPVRLVTPGNRHWQLDVGGKAEMVVLSALIALAVALYPLSHLGFRDALQALLKSFDIAVEQYARQIGTRGYDLELVASDNLVMDYYEGESLLEYLERHGGKLPWRAALELMLPVLDGLREVHRCGFLHRDVKPHNIYLTTQGRPILLDFGSARQAMGERSRSLSVMITEGYAPFEQYHRRGQGPWTDIYGAAATLYLLVTGQTPPPATERIRQDELIPPLQWVPDLPQSLNVALLYGLATDPQQRPQTMEQFEQWLHDGVLEGKAPTPDAPVEIQFPVKPKVQLITEPKLFLSDYVQKKGVVALAAAMGLIGVILLITQINWKPKSVDNSTQQLATTSTQQTPPQIPQKAKPSEAEIQQWINNGDAYTKYY